MAQKISFERLGDDLAAAGNLTDATAFWELSNQGHAPLIRTSSVNAKLATTPLLELWESLQPGTPPDPELRAKARLVPESCGQILLALLRILRRYRS